MGWCTCFWCVPNSACCLPIYLWALALGAYIHNWRPIPHPDEWHWYWWLLVLFRQSFAHLAPGRPVPCFALIRGYNSLKSLSFGDRFPTTDWWFPFAIPPSTHCTSHGFCIWKDALLTSDGAGWSSLLAFLPDYISITINHFKNPFRGKGSHLDSSPYSKYGCPVLICGCRKRVLLSWK